MESEIMVYSIRKTTFRMGQFFPIKFKDIIHSEIDKRDNNFITIYYRQKETAHE